ncbi:MAG: response regulator [Elusimicrobiota bacterium]
MPGKIIVVDDDPIVGNLTRELLADAGYEVQLISDSMVALEAIKAQKPLLAVLDILMPGIDGLTLCHQIKNEPTTQAVKVAIVSGKAFHADRQRAAKYGADLFIEKPYDIENFGAMISGLIGGAVPAPKAAPAPAPMAAVAEPKLHFTIWGCRSLSPIKAGESSAYGRASSCVSLETGGHMLIFDAGTGIQGLGEKLVRSNKHKALWLFLTQFNQDHVEGLASFACARQPGYTLNISGANDPDISLQDRIAEIFETASSKLGDVQCAFELYEMKEESYDILPGLKLTSFFANHPGTTLGFIVESEGRKTIYCPDSEIYGERGTALQDYDEKLGALCAGADLLIHDGRYTDADYQTRKDNGHSSWVSTVKFAGRNKVKRLVLFHHDDQYSDKVLDSIDAQARALIAEKGYALDFAMAREGLKISV